MLLLDSVHEISVCKCYNDKLYNNIHMKSCQLKTYLFSIKPQLYLTLGLKFNKILDGERSKSYYIQKERSKMINRKCVSSIKRDKDE
jgi:hypothetical protein